MPPRIEHRIIDEFENKVCKGILCRENENKETWKSLSEFGKDNNAYDNLKTICKKCKNYSENKNYAKNPRPRKTEEEIKKNKLGGYNKQRIPIIEKDNIKGKICKDCKKWHPLTDFNKEGLNYITTGEPKYKRMCKYCRNSKRMDKRKEISEVKENEKKEMIENKLKNHIPIPKKEPIKREFKKYYENGKLIISSEHKICEGIELKFCLEHGEWLSLNKFYNKKNCIDKLTIICIDCIHKRNIENYNYHKCKHDKPYHLCFDCYPNEYLGYYNKIKIKRNTDANFKIKENLRGRIYKAISGKVKKSKTTMKLIGCTVDELYNHLESKFENGMTRDNYCEIWQIDHIIPCALFDLTNPREQLRCFNWRNLQPLTCSDNNAKRCKYTFDIIKEIELWKATITYPRKFKLD